MDPVSALGVAAAVVQFVDFAYGLISTSNKIFHSIKGASLENLELKEVYGMLYRLGAELEIRPRPEGTASTLGSALPSSKQVSDLRQLSEACKLDCDELLGILRKLTVEKGKNRLWRSVKAALQNAASRRKIAEIEARLERAQRTMSLLIATITRDHVSDLEETLKSLKKQNQRLHASQTSKIDGISKRLDGLKLTEASRPEMPSVDQIENLITKLSALSTDFDSTSREQAILESLYFPCKPVRHGTIPDAYANTFRWIFQSSFSQWLESQNESFWISGKAGSGKSTFMKFIADNSQTRDILQTWASPKKVAIAAHYFWSSGTAMQKSQQGLLQSLLFEIYRQCPSCISVSSPSRWEEAGGRLYETRTKSWIVPELLEALRTVAKQEDLPVKFCFFIDGMDEFDDTQLEHRELCEIFHGLCRSPHIKICTSSRPWNVFEDEFGQDPSTKLYIHELTRNDIVHFAKGRLEGHPKWATYTMEEEQKQSLINDIGDKANGVFLWAFLVTRSLRNGLDDEDTVHDLRKRLESIPTDLERLFKHMLESIEPVYHEKMAGILQIALHAKAPLTIDIYGYHDREYQDENYAINCPVEVPTIKQGLELDRQTRRRINARTRGLLEAKKDHVEFIHRTVHDFLQTTEMSNFLLAKSKPRFDAYCSILRAYIALIKSTRFAKIVRTSPGQSGGYLISLLRETLNYVPDAAVSSNSQVTLLLNTLEHSIGEMFETSQASFIYGKCEGRLLFREEALRSNLAKYISQPPKRHAEEEFAQETGSMKIKVD
ncbi:Ff.00g040360.m01.CDS01 [Fusarium sp. VM40]|nr:Ff.00g040360.m01.CDS01 [Fusarium sp. VM40]